MEGCQPNDINTTRVGTEEMPVLFLVRGCDLRMRSDATGEDREKTSPRLGPNERLIDCAISVPETWQLLPGDIWHVYLILEQAKCIFICFLLYGGTFLGDRYDDDAHQRVAFVSFRDPASVPGNFCCVIHFASRGISPEQFFSIQLVIKFLSISPYHLRKNVPNAFENE